MRAFLLLAGVLVHTLSAGEASETTQRWCDRFLGVGAPADDRAGGDGASIELLRQDHERLASNRSILETPLRIGGTTYAGGLGAHAVSHIRVTAPQPMVGFSAWVGVDRNGRTEGGQGSVRFSRWLAPARPR